MRTKDELDHGASRDCRGGTVDTGIVHAECGDSHLPCGVQGPALTQKTGFLVSLLKLSAGSMNERLPYSWLVSPTFRPFSSTAISLKFEFNGKLIRPAVIASMFVPSDLLILTCTWRRELFRSGYRSFATCIVNSMEEFCWIVASGTS